MNLLDEYSDFLTLHEFGVSRFTKLRYKFYTKRNDAKGPTVKAVADGAYLGVWIKFDESYNLKYADVEED